MIKMIQGPFHYTGNKFRIVETMLEHIPENTNTFYEMFGGSGVVGLNAVLYDKVQRFHYNELNEKVYHLFRLAVHCQNFAAHAINIHDKYPETKEGYLKLRDDYNNSSNEFKKCAMLYNLIGRSFSNDVRFNDAGEMNMPYGDRSTARFDVLTKLSKQVEFFLEKITTSNGSYTDALKLAKPGDLVFVDPPYFNTVATYNSFWQERDEIRLYTELEQLTSRGVNWMLTNTTFNRGNENKILTDWLSKTDGLHISETGTSYQNTSFRKSKDITVEVLVTNYKVQKHNLETFFD